MISVAGLSKSFADRTLFESVTLQLDAGERYGLVGANGSGKTTLMGILGGIVEPSEGMVSIPKDLTLGILEQDAFSYDDQPILGVALMGNRELWDAMAEKAELLAGAEEAFDAARFSTLEEIVQHHDGYAAEARAAAILEGLGLPAEVHDRPLSTLSGGFKLRVLLAQVLAATPDVLLLDEPTNHLDILSIRWLEKFLTAFPGPVVVISHDHRFLDNVATQILDVDYRTVLSYSGDYSAFAVAKRMERERRAKEIEGREREIAHHRKFVDRFRAKASKARQAQSKLRLIEKKAESLEELPASSRRHPKFAFEQTRPSGRDVLTLRDIHKAFADNEVLHGVHLEVRRGDRVAILGPNGIGKSTLLKIAVGELAPDSGSVSWGYETHPGYFAQDHEEQLDAPDRTAVDWIWDACPGRDIGFVRSRMGLLLFSGEEADKRLGSLSGGEAARLVFCRLAIQQPNVLALDEPTNHLDLEAIEALVTGLKRYPGTLIFVSHDRWFVGKLATRVLEISRNGVRDYQGTYEEYVHACGDDHLDADAVVLEAREKKRQARRDKHSEARDREPPRTRPYDPARPRRLKSRLREVTSAVEQTEARLREIDAAFSEPAFYGRTDPEAMRALEAERARLQSETEGLIAEWESVERELEGLGGDGA